MNIKSVYSNKRDYKEAVNEINQELKGFDAKLLVFFASTHYDQDGLNKEMKNQFSNADIIGCSSAGEMVSGHLFKNSVVVMAFNSAALEDVSVEVVPNIKADSGEGVEKALDKFGKYYGEKASDLSVREYVGMIFLDWISASEEKVMDKIGDLTNVAFIGASAADNLRFEKTYVYANGQVYTDAAVLALLKPKTKFHFLKTQNFVPTNAKLVATKTKPDTREVLEFNNKPAAEAYAEALGVSVEDLDEKLFTHPVGLIAGEDFYIRSPQKVDGEKMYFYCNLLDGMEVSMLEPTDIIEETKNAFEEKKKEIENVSGVIDFHCILRTLDLRNKGLTKEYGEIFKDHQMIGLASYGQEFIGHIDQTSMILIFE